MQAVRLIRVDLHGFISSRGSENQTVIVKKKRYKIRSHTHVRDTQFYWVSMAARLYYCVLSQVRIDLCSLHNRNIKLTGESVAGSIIPVALKTYIVAWKMVMTLSLICLPTTSREQVYGNSTECWTRQDVKSLLDESWSQFLVGLENSSFTEVGAWLPTSLGTWPVLPYHQRSVRQPTIQTQYHWLDQLCKKYSSQYIDKFHR
jgi:hypothetical protein